MSPSCGFPCQCFGIYSTSNWKVKTAVTGVLSLGLLYTIAGIIEMQTHEVAPSSRFQVLPLPQLRKLDDISLHVWPSGRFYMGLCGYHYLVSLPAHLQGGLAVPKDRRSCTLIPFPLPFRQDLGTIEICTAQIDASIPSLKPLFNVLLSGLSAEYRPSQQSGPKYIVPSATEQGRCV